MAITDETYVLLTTFRRNGDGVGTPVWIAPLPDGRGGFTTEAGSGKVKRIGNNPQVTLQACDMRGRVRSDAPVYTATAEVLLGADADPVLEAIRRKHPVMTRLLAVGALVRRIARRTAEERCAIRLTLG